MAVTASAFNSGFPASAGLPGGPFRFGIPQLASEEYLPVGVGPDGKEHLI
jgi:hypothetical protein